MGKICLLKDSLLLIYIRLRRLLPCAMRGYYPRHDRISKQTCFSSIIRHYKFTSFRLLPLPRADLQIANSLIMVSRSPGMRQRPLSRIWRAERKKIGQMFSILILRILSSTLFCQCHAEENRSLWRVPIYDQPKRSFASLLYASEFQCTSSGLLFLS